MVIYFQVRVVRLSSRFEDDGVLNHLLLASLLVEAAGLRGAVRVAWASNPVNCVAGTVQSWCVCQWRRE